MEYAIYLDKKKSQLLFKKLSQINFSIRVYLTRNLKKGDIVYLCANKDYELANVMKCKVISSGLYEESIKYRNLLYETKKDRWY